MWRKACVHAVGRPAGRPYNDDRKHGCPNDDPSPRAKLAFHCRDHGEFQIGVHHTHLRITRDARRGGIVGKGYTDS